MVGEMKGAFVILPGETCNPGSWGVVNSHVAQDSASDDRKASNKSEEATPTKGAASSTLVVAVLKQPHWSLPLVASCALRIDNQDLRDQLRLLPNQ